VCTFCGARFRHEDNFEVHVLTRHHYEIDSMTTGNTIKTESSNQEVEGWESSQISKDLECEEARQRIPPFLGSFSYHIAPVNIENRNLGVFNGVQGENNSCYVDASLMAMFYTNDTFDSLLSSHGATPGCAMDEEIWYYKTFLTRHVVNSLRQRGFVEASFVMELRRMIEPFFHGGVDFSSNCERHEACDFVRFLIEMIGMQDHRSVSFGIESANDSSGRASMVMSEVMVQLLPPPNAEHCTLSADQLLLHFQESQGLHFRDMAKSLILQLPRNGSKHRPVRAVFPDPYLWVDEYRSRHCDRNQGSNSQVVRKICFELRAVIAIGTGHYVTYMRIPKSGRGRSQWLYADSMSDRQFGCNVPLVEDVTDELNVLEFPNAMSMLIDQPTRVSSALAQSHLERITQDASMLFYSFVSTHPAASPSGALPVTAGKMVKKAVPQLMDRPNGALFSLQSHQEHTTYDGSMPLMGGKKVKKAISQFIDDRPTRASSSAHLQCEGTTTQDGSMPGVSPYPAPFPSEALPGVGKSMKKKARGRATGRLE
jgi:hypothetical protein